MTSKSTLARWATATLFASATLLGCNQSGVDPSSGNPAPAPPADLLDALVLGPVESAYLEPLKPNLNLVQHDGGQKVEDFHMVIFDGHAHTPDAVSEHALVEQALGAGKLVLALDLTEAHKKDGLEALLGTSTCGDTPVYALRRLQDGNGRPVMQVFEGRPGTVTKGRGELQDPADSAACGGTPSLAAQAAPDADTAKAFAAAFTERFSPRSLTTQQVGAGDPPSDLPKDLLYVTYQFTNFNTWKLSEAGEAPVTAPQVAGFEQNYTVTVFLDNKASPQGSFQYVLVETALTHNPTNGTGAFLAKRWKSSNNWVVPTYNEWAWFTDTMWVTHAPRATDWTTISTSPETVNNQNSATTSSTFSIGFSGLSGTGSYSYSTSVTEPLTDWKLLNMSSALKGAWAYNSAYPFDWDIPVDSCSQPMRGNACYLRKEPNDLSINNMQLRTQTVYRTPGVVDGSVELDVVALAGMADVFCQENGGLICLETDGNQQSSLQQHTYTIDLGAVIPVPIASLTFSPGASVKAGTTATGTVTLSRPAKVDTAITLASNSPNATVLPTVTVKKGATSADFQILTNANGIAAGGQSVATITAFYADDFQAQLTLTN